MEVMNDLFWMAVGGFAVSVVVAIFDNKREPEPPQCNKAGFDDYGQPRIETLEYYDEAPWSTLYQAKR